MRIEHRLQIEAPPERVWAVTEDVEHWPEWSPTMDSVTRVDHGPFGLGSSARIKQPGLPEATWTVDSLERDRAFHWSTRVRGLGMRAGHELIPSERGTLSLLSVELSGWVGKLLGPLIRGSVAKAIAQENEGLKARCEERA